MTPQPETPQPETPQPETPQPETPQPETPQPGLPAEQLALGYFINPEYPSDQSMHTALAHQRGTVRLAAELGMAATFVGEHFSFGDFAWLPPLPLLTGVHDVAPGMLFGTAVLSGPLHHPAVLAEQAAFLDGVTEGRFVLGLAAGWNPFEFETLGVPLAGRGRRLEEAVGVLRTLWRGEGPTDFPGPNFRYRSLSLGLRPHTPGGPPLWLGGGNRVSIDRAARLADAWIASSHVPDERAVEQSELYRDALRRAGRERPEVRPGLRNVFVARTHEEAVRKAGPYLTASYRMFDRWGLFSEVLDQRTTEVDFQVAAQRAVIGDVDTVAERLATFVAASGVNLLLVRSQWLGIPHRYLDENLVLLATEVLPKVRAELAKGCGR